MLRARNIAREIRSKFDGPIRVVDSTEGTFSADLELWSSSWAVTVQIDIEGVSDDPENLQIRILDGDFEDVEEEEFLLTKLEILLHSNGVRVNGHEQAVSTATRFVENYVKSYLE